MGTRLRRHFARPAASRDGTWWRGLSSRIDAIGRGGGRTAVLALRTDGEARWSFEELDARVRRLASGLRELGLRRGDALALFADPGPEWIAAFLAGLRAGVVVVPIDAQHTGDTLAHIVADSGARRMFTSTRGLERLSEIGRGPECFLLDAPAEDERSWTSLERDVDEPLPPIADEEPVLLLYTSGTTGRPKGVPLTGVNLVAQIDAVSRVGLIHEEASVLMPLPLHHVYPLVVGTLAPLLLGARVVLPHSLVGPELLRAIREGEATLIVGVPRLYESLLAAIESRASSSGRFRVALFRRSLAACTALRRRTGLHAGRWSFRSLHRRMGPRLRHLACGGASLDERVAWALEGLGWHVVVGYGLTETSPLLTIDTPPRSRIGSVGRPIPGVEIRIADSRAPSADGRAEGEILARGPSVFAGYHRLPGATAEAFTPDGWFRTGDRGRLDRDGYLYVLGRISTLIVLPGGEKVDPERLEEVLAAQPSIREIAVFLREGKLTALVVPEAGRSADVVREELVRAARSLPSYQRVADLAVTHERLPRTHLGKLQRHLVSERFERARAGERGPPAGPMDLAAMSTEDRALLDDPAARAVWELLAERYRERSLTPDTSPRLELGVDSLAWLDLSLAIAERAGVELSEEALGRVESVRGLLREATTAGREPRIDPLQEPERALGPELRRWLEPLGPVGERLAEAIRLANRASMRAVFHVRAEGLEHVPRGRPLVFAPNHASYLDVFALHAVLDRERLRDTYWAGLAEILLANPLLRTGSRLGRALPVDPQRSVTSTLALTAMALEHGKSLVWFPEGRRSPTGELQPFRPGIGLLLRRFRTPVVPVLIRGSFEALPVGRAWPRPVPIRVVFGEPLDPLELEERGAGGTAHERIADALHDAVARLGETETTLAQLGPRTAR